MFAHWSKYEQNCKCYCLKTGSSMKAVHWRRRGLFLCVYDDAFHLMCP